MPWGAHRRTGFGLVLVLGLAACAANPTPAPGSIPSSPASTAAAPLGSNVTPSLGTAAGPTNALSVTASGAAEPGRLIGLSRDAVLQTLGRPIFMREDGPAQLWRYPWAECYLEVFLFRDQGIYQVTHAELRPRLAGIGGTGNCSDRGSAARRSRPSS